LKGRVRVCFICPPYSPDFNPIEMAWSKIKQFLRTAQARTVEARLRGDRSDFTNPFSKRCQGFFQHVGFCI
jgi:transposase